MVKKLSVALCGLLVCSLLFSACSTPYMTKGRMARTKKGDSYTLYANEEKPLAGLYFQQHASTPSFPVSVEETLTLSSIKNGKSYKSIVYLDVFSVRNWIGIDGSIEIPLFLALSRIKHFGFSVLTFEDDKLKNIVQYFSINPTEMEYELHYYAKQLLDDGKVESAWQVLLAGENV